MKENLIKLLKDLEAVKEAFTKVGEGEQRDELKTRLNTAVSEYISKLPENAKDEIANWTDFDTKISLTIEDTNLIKDWSDFSTELFGEWNDSAAQLTVVGLLQSGAKFEESETNKFLKYEELYTSVVEGHALYGKDTTVTSSQMIELADEYEFLSQGKDPVKTIGEKLVLKVLGSYNEAIPLITSERGTVLADTNSEFVLDIAKNFQQPSESLEKILDLLKEDISVEQVETLLKVTEIPLVISDAVLADLFLEADSKNSYLAPLVGIVRKFNITESDYNSIREKYSMLGNLTLESILKNSWAAPKEALNPIEEPKPLAIDENSETSTTSTPSTTFVTKVTRRGKTS